MFSRAENVKQSVGFFINGKEYNGKNKQNNCVLWAFDETFIFLIDA